MSLPKVTNPEIGAKPELLLALARRYPIIPRVVTDLGQLDKKGGNSSNFFEVKDVDRVLHGSIEPKDDKWFYEIRFSDMQTIIPETETEFPSFVLPYLDDHITRLTLQKSLKHPSVPEPALFFTTALSGCAIFVEADLGAPTAYHANAKSAKVENVTQSFVRLMTSERPIWNSGNGTPLTERKPELATSSLGHPRTFRADSRTNLTR